MKKLLLIVIVLLICYTEIISSSFDLMVKLDTGLPTSGRNGSHLGKELCGIGDVNNDGFADWAIGLPRAAEYQSGKCVGKVYIYLGSSDLLDEKKPDLILLGKVERKRFGYRIAKAGDVNNDGYDDIMVSSYYSAYPPEQKGGVFIYYGGNPMDNEPDVVISNNMNYEVFGICISGAGDLNNDDYDDIIIGAAGHALVYYGGKNMNSIPDIEFACEFENSSFGFSVSNAGDVNGDSYSDIIIGERMFRSDGYAYLYFGSSNMDSIADLTLAGNINDYEFGEVVAGAGDLNNDGFDDVVISAKTMDSNEDMEGKVYILYGGTTMGSEIYAILKPGFNFLAFSQVLCPIGDTNNDGFDDVLAGSNENVFILYGNSSNESIDIIQIFNETSGFTCISGIGDVNGDNFSDFILSKSYDSSGGEESGRVLLYYGGESFDKKVDLILTGESGCNYFGSSLSHAGDINNDGYDDIIIGSPFDDTYAINAGSAYIYYGKNDFIDNPDLILLGEQERQRFGNSVSCAGDFNNDGYDDIIIGSSNKSYANLYLGGYQLNLSDSYIFRGEKSYDSFGHCVSDAGDVNNDGFDDIIIGAHTNYATGTQAGRAYIYLGGSVIDVDADIIFPGEGDFNYFGSQVTTAGDFNNDGFDDVVISAPGFDVDSLCRGRVYVYLGGQPMDSEVDLIIDSNSPYQNFGRSISNLGDFNNDGYDDIVVGAPYSNALGLGESSVYIFYGGKQMNDVADVTITKDWMDFGVCVSYAGDVDKDGYSDLMVSDMSLVFIYYGSKDSEKIEEDVINSEAHREWFGISLSHAGDINNDGLSDILIGAPFNSATGTYNGRAYIYSVTDNVPILNTNENYINSFELFQNYPNPFNSETTIVYKIVKTENVSIKIYDINGKEIIKIFNVQQVPGLYKFRFNAKELSSGVYLYQVKAGYNCKSKKFIILK